jgi:hypothetical protein
MSQSELRLRLARLQQQRSEHSRSLHGTSSLTPFSPLRGGFGRLEPIQPIIIGEEVALVNDGSMLCLGRIGTGSAMCLKPASECDTESHIKKKGTLPLKPCLIQLKGEDKGYDNVILEIGNLEEVFVRELMEKVDVDWVSEFTMIEENESTNSHQRQLVDETVKTARKQRNFMSPKKEKAGAEFDTNLVLLDTSSKLILDVLNYDVDADGSTSNRDLEFAEDAYVKNGTLMHDSIDVLLEHANVVSNTITSIQPFVESQVAPVEQLTAGLRIDMANANARIGAKNLSRKDIPPSLWNAVETGFDSVLAVESRLEKVEVIAQEAHEAASYLISTEESITTPRKEDKPVKGDSPKGVDAFGKSFRINEGNTYGGVSKSGEDEDAPRRTHNSTHGCDVDDTLCSKCFKEIRQLEEKVTASSIRIGNLEDAKNGNIDSAVMVKDRIYRGRNDIAAELDGWFTNLNKHIDAGLFPTPHLILNLMHADMCSKTGPKIPLDQRDMIRHSIRRSDADAFYALQSDKPEFMITKDLCPNYIYKTTSAQKSSAAFKFIPSHEDFGNGLDSDSLHYKFKSSLEYVKGKTDRYIESSLGDHPDHRAYTVAKQLLDDSCKFVSQMLGFMEEVYTSCFDSFGASSEAWELVCHCVQEIFTKELKPSLKHCVAQDLVHVSSALVGVIHSAFSLNCKVRELTSVGLKNHHSTTTSHVRFVLKMAKSDRKSNNESAKSKSNNQSQGEVIKLEKTISALKTENTELKAHVRRVEGRLDSFIAKVNLQLKSNLPGKVGKPKAKEDKLTKGDDKDSQ